MADQMAVYVGALPVIIVSAIRLSQRRGSWRIDVGLLAAAAASVALAMAGTLLIRRAGGFVAAPTNAVFITSAQLPHNESLTAESALTSAAGANGTAASAVAQFGAPVRTARIGTYEVLVWNHDLLPAVTGGSARGCGPPWLEAEHVSG